MDDSRKNNDVYPLDVIQEKIDSMFFPELISNNQVISFVDENFSFKIADLSKISIFQQISNQIGDVVERLKKCIFLKDVTNDTATIKIDEGLSYVFIFNVPKDRSNESLLKDFNLNSTQIERFYKNNDWWYLVLKADQWKASESYFTKYKFEMKSSEEIIKKIKQKIQMLNYQKEAVDLKADSPQVENNKKTEQNSSRKNSEAFSWRKLSKDVSCKRDSIYSNYNSQDGKKGFRQNNSDSKRLRLNSEGNSIRKQSNYQGRKFSNHDNGQGLEELEIDLTNIKYSLNIKYKYSLQQMLQAYEVLNQLGTFDSSPNFCLDEKLDIIADEKKEIHIIKRGRERSNTFSNGISAVKATNGQAMGTLNIPRNNPLSNIGKN